MRSKTLKTIIPITLCMLMLTVGCAKAEKPSEEAVAKPQQPEIAATPGIDLIGFVVEDDGEMPTYMMMHGFLHTAENLGYPAKLYRVTSSAEASVNEAVADGCRGLLIEAQYANAIAEAKKTGLYVVVPYEKCDESAADVCVVADNTEFIEELARGIAERMTERSLKSGRILIYGYDTEESFAKISAAIAEYYPQFGVSQFSRTAGTGDEAAIEELSEYILNNRDVKGLYACDALSAPIAVSARSRAIAKFGGQSEAKSTPKAETTPAPGASPTPNPNLLKQISITVFGTGINDANLALFNDNDIYALCIEPYYEATATAAMMLDKLMLGEETAEIINVNRPIAYLDTIDKYLATYEQVKEMFDLNG